MLESVESLIPPTRIVDDIETCVLAASRIWNATRPRTSDADRRTALTEAEDLLRQFVRGRARTRRVVEGIERRFRREHPDVERRVTAVRFVPVASGLHQLQVVSSADAEAAVTPLHPLVSEVERRIAQVMANEPAATPVAIRHALQALEVFAGLDPDALARRGADVWAAAALHAAFQHLPSPRLTTAHLAARFGVTVSAVGNMSMQLRRLVDWDFVYDGNPLAQLVDGLEHSGMALEGPRAPGATEPDVEASDDRPGALKSGHTPPDGRNVRKQKRPDTPTSPDQLGMFDV